MKFYNSHGQELVTKPIWMLGFVVSWNWRGWELDQGTYRKKIGAICARHFSHSYAKNRGISKEQAMVQAMRFLLPDRPPGNEPAPCGIGAGIREKNLHIVVVTMITGCQTLPQPSIWLILYHPFWIVCAGYQVTSSFMKLLPKINQTRRMVNSMQMILWPFLFHEVFGHSDHNHWKTHGFSTDLNKVTWSDTYSWGYVTSRMVVLLAVS